LVHRRGDGQGADDQFVNHTSAAPMDSVIAVEKQEPSESPVSSLLSYAILLGGILTVAVTVYMVVISYSGLPYWDGWIQIDVAANGNNPLSPGWLWQQHNEHRLVLPKLFLAADLRLFQARQVFLLTSIFAVQLLHLALLSWSMWVLGGWRRTLWRTGTGLAAFCLFCPSQQENLIWGFQICFVLPLLLATVAFVALLLYWTESQEQPDKQPPTRFLVMSILAAVGASYSLSNGNLLWPLLVAAALYLRLRRPAILALAVSGVVSTGLYLYHYARPQYHADPIASLATPLTLLKYLAVYFFSSWGHQDIHAAEFVLLAGLGIAIALLFPALSYARNFRVFALQLALTMAFCAATAIVTAAGRANLGVGQAVASRYQTVALLFWCCLGLLLLGSASARPGIKYSFQAAQLCLLVLLLRGALIARYPIAEARRGAFSQNAAAASLITGVHDPAALSETFPQSDLLLKSAHYLKTNHLSVFAGSIPSEMEKPLESVFSLAASGDCAGAVESVARVDETGGAGLRLAGWAWDAKHHLPPSTVVVITNGIISGLGAEGQWRPNVRTMKPTMSSSYIGFVGFVPEPASGVLVKVYVVLRSNPPVACYIAAKDVPERADPAGDGRDK
jgi:hypothetical protein